jgi:hypothetical protein
MAIKVDEIVILLGAGCSSEAGIPTSNEMVRKIEDEILKAAKNKKFEDLYYYVKSAITYGQNIQRKFDIPFNIEELMNVLLELEKREGNIIYPFIANWNNLLVELAGGKFNNVKEFKELINENLLRWVKVDNYQHDAEYYGNFYRFRDELQISLRVFSLNYDLCFEKLSSPTVKLELGFDDEKVWNCERFEFDPNKQVDIFLYKLHGSIDWKRDNHQVIKCDAPVDQPLLIFGIPSKLQSYDPFLFYIYELRKYTLSSRLIITIGYGFGDEHINHLLQQALQQRSKTRLFCVTKHDDPEAVKNAIRLKLNPGNIEQILVFSAGAKAFLDKEITRENMEEAMIPEEKGPF